MSVPIRPLQLLVSASHLDCLRSVFAELPKQAPGRRRGEVYQRVRREIHQADQQGGPAIPRYPATKGQGRSRGGTTLTFLLVSVL